jgi:hypothetical protein
VRRRPYVNYSERGQKKRVIGRTFTIQYTVIDYLGNRVYHFEEREKEHIVPERKVKDQGFLLRYLDRIPPILHTPSEVIVDPEDETIHIYYKRHRIPEQPSINRLAVVVKSAEVRFVLTFYGHTSRHLKGETKVKKAIYLKR